MGCKNTITTADAMTFEDFNDFLNKLHKDKLYNWEMFCLTAFATGCRGGDVLNLRWVDLIDKNSLIIPEKKTGKVRKIPFNKDVQKRFLKIWEAANKPNRALPILPSQGSPDKPMSIQFVNRTLKRFRVKYQVKIDNFSTHTFRKTLGRHVYDTMGRSPESLMLLSQIFKHTNIATTMVYLGITKDEINGIFNTIKF